jgi:hypothetical protein
LNGVRPSSALQSSRSPDIAEGSSQENQSVSVAARQSQVFKPALHKHQAIKEANLRTDLCSSAFPEGFIHQITSRVGFFFIRRHQLFLSGNAFVAFPGIANTVLGGVIADRKVGDNAIVLVGNDGFPQIGLEPDCLSDLELVNKRIVFVLGRGTAPLISAGGHAIHPLTDKESVSLKNHHLHHSGRIPWPP